MCQKLINRNVDYFYNQQIRETEHQHHRLSWILAAQSIIFVGLCTLLPNVGKEYVEQLIWLLAAIGVSLSISGIYSVLVGELSIGTILERWDEYDSKNKREKCKEVPHQVILSPSSVMRSRLQFLMLYSFAPKVFCAAWIALLAYVLTDKYIITTILNFPNLTIICYYLIVLIAICIVARYASRFLLFQWFYMDTREKRSRKKCVGCSYTFDAECMPGCGDTMITNGNAFNKCQINLLNGCCRTGKCYCCDNLPKPNRCKGMYNAPYTTKVSDLRIYHIVIDRFNGGWTVPPENKNDFLGGNIRGIIDRLDYIASKGYNAILLTPIFQSAAYHGYHTIDYSQIDPHFGTWQDFQELVDTAHAKRIKIMCDFVPNHCHISNRLFEDTQKNTNSRYRNWFNFDQSRRGGFVSYQNYPDIPKFNLFDSAAADYMIHIAMNLAKKGIDGLRIDHAIGVPFQFLKNLNSELKRINPEILVFGEVCPYNLNDLSQVEFKCCSRKEEVVKGDPNVQDNMQLDYVGVLDGVLDFEYRNIILGEISHRHHLFGNTDLQRRLKTHFSKYPPGFCLLLFLDNHDTNRILFSCNGDRTLMDEAVEFTRSLPYPSIIYYGTEIYMTNKTDIDDGTAYADLEVREPMDWNLVL